MSASIRLTIATLRLPVEAIVLGRVKMDVPVTEEQIRTLAFYLWEKDGSPDGRSEEYWEKARQQLGVGDNPPELQTGNVS